MIKISSIKNMSFILKKIKVFAGMAELASFNDDCKPDENLLGRGVGGNMEGLSLGIVPICRFESCSQQTKTKEKEKQNER